MTNRELKWLCGKMCYTFEHKVHSIHNYFYSIFKPSIKQEQVAANSLKEHTVYIGSENPVKINSTRLAFQQIFKDKVSFKFIGKSVPSGVNAQPIADAETLQGAYNRALALKQLFPDGKYHVGIEGGIDHADGSMHAFAWVIILNGKNVGKSRTATFQVPLAISNLVESGMELGHATDVIYNEQNSKSKGGTVGQLTDGHIDRTEYYRHAVVLALIPFLNPQLYSE